MRDVILSIFLVAGTYICSTGFAIMLFRMFFLLKTKSLETSKLAFEEGGNRWRSSAAKPRVGLLTVGGRKDFVKISS